MKTCFVTNYPKKEFFQETKFIVDDNIKSEDRVKINVNPRDIKQSLVGFGGAFTEAASVVFNSATPEIKEQIIKMYFDKETGLGYQLGRMAINSCDFSLGNYTYIKKNAQDLRKFNIRREKKYTIPFVKEAMVYAKDLKMATAPWSPPKHFKTNDDMNNGGKLLKAYYTFYSDYIVKYMLEMRRKGIKIEYLSLQNEPEANQTWDSCLYTPEEMIELVKVIAPNLKKNNLNAKIVVLDHNRDLLEKWATAVAADKEALELIWGLAIHWYVSEDFDALRRAKEIAPSLNIIFTEGCVEGGPKPYAIHTGERYARNIIGDLNNGCAGYIDWNLLLNEQGGPNHKQNYCDAPMLLMNDGSLVVNSSYYYIGHFAKFFRSGSKVLGSTVSDTRLQVLAGLSTKKERIVVICNPTDDHISYQVDGIKEDIKGIISAHTIQTWVVKKDPKPVQNEQV